MENKKFNYRRIITIVIVLLIWAAILLIFVDSKPIYGKWNCGDNMAINFRRTRSFEIYNVSNKDEIYVEGTFKAKRLKADLPKIKYEVTLEADEETQSGYKKDLKISLNQTKLNEMIIVDNENTKYTCKRIK